MLLTQSKFGQILGISRQSVDKAVKAIPPRLEKTGTKIDTDSALNKLFIDSKPEYRQNFNAYINSVATVENETVTKKPRKSDPEESEKTTIPLVETPENYVPGTGGAPLSLADISHATAQAKMVKAKNDAAKTTLEIEKLRNNMADREILSFVIERFLNHFTTGTKRVSNTALRDISKEILARGEIVNADYMIFEDANLELVDTAKQKLLSDLKTYKI